MARCKLGNLEFEVVVDTQISYKNSVSRRRVEKGYELTDHIKQMPLTLSISVKSNNKNWLTERNELIRMRNSKSLFNFYDLKSNKTYENLVISSISFTESVSQFKGFSASLTLEQVRVGQVREVDNIGDESIRQR